MLSHGWVRIHEPVDDLRENLIVHRRHLYVFDEELALNKENMKFEWQGPDFLLDEVHR